MLSLFPQRSFFHAAQSCEGDWCTLLLPLWKTWWQNHSNEHRDSWHWSPPWPRQPEGNHPNKENTREDQKPYIKITVTSAEDDFCGLTLPYLLKSVFRSVALVVEDRPLTQRFLLVAAALPAATCRSNPISKHQLKDRKDLSTLKHYIYLHLSSFDSLSGSFSSELQTEKREAIKYTAVGTQVTLKKYLCVYMVWYITEWPANHDPQCSDLMVNAWKYALWKFQRISH